MAVQENKKHYAIIGGGVSGLSTACMLREAGCEVTVFEKESTPGGLVRCVRVEGILYHCVGGHVFNSRKQEVLDWFWQHLDKNDFQLATRNAVVSLEDGTKVDYPIENHLYQMQESLRSAIIDDLLQIAAEGYAQADNFDEFLRNRFGNTLYNEYFAPYNRKIWRRKLTDVPLTWLEGKLPMPTVKEILEANIGQVKEMKMVHSTFHYPKQGGSQHIADSLAAGLDVRYNSPVDLLEKVGNQWCVNGEVFDAVIFCGNIKHLPAMLKGINVDLSGVERLSAHGTTSVLCEVEANPYSWVYMPSAQHESHRVICTGNFAESNSPAGMSTATIEFTLQLDKEEILKQLQLIPFSPRYIAHHYCPYTYPVQTSETPAIIADAKAQLAPHGIYLLGRFAEWEYYNMDAAMAAAMKLTEQLCSY
ncbi:MAG: FAD-dependent oxidoreductase [Akkermansia sp.]|nr:FAD-dependent oxidoreductase [Akkermansia sp.]